MKNFVLLVCLIVCANTFGAGSLSYLKSQQFVTKHITTPSNPASGHNKLYSKSDNKLYFLTSAGAEANLLTSPVGLAGSDVSGTLPTTKGGTGIASYTTGDILYSSASNVLSVLAAGTNGYVLTLAGGVPTWAAAAGGGVSSIGTINSQTKSANGAVISGSTLVMQEADATSNGLVSTGAQTLAGVKTFSSAPNLSSLTASLPLKLDASKNVTAAAIDLTSAEVTGALVATKGGTAQSTYTTGDTLYASASNTVSKLPIGSTGRVLTVVAGVPSWESPPISGSGGYIKLNTGNNWGSTNTEIRRFSTTTESVGGDITYTDSATNGASFTINNDGLYAITYSDYNISGSFYFFGISRNSTQLTTSIESITNTHRLAIGKASGVGAAYTELGTVTAIEHLNAGDVIRAHSGGSSTSSGDTDSRVSFYIAKIGQTQPLRTYCALTDASGNISLETEPWVTGTCTFAAGYNTCELDFSFTQKPVCYANQLSSTSGETTYRDDLSDTNTVVIQTFNSSGTTTARAHAFCCTGPR